MKKLLIIVAVFALTAMAVSAEEPAKKLNGIAGIGVSLPSSPSEFSDYWKMGFNGYAGIAMNSTPKMQLLGKVEYHNFAIDADINEGGITFVMFGGAAKFNLSEPNAPTQPFLIGGLGMANASIDVPGAESETKIYFEFGGGIGFNSQFSVMARYVSVATEGESFSYIPINVGFTF